MEKPTTPKKTGNILLISILVAVVIAIVLVVIFTGSGDVTVSVESGIKEIIAASNLRTAKYTYNSVAEVKNGNTTKYYVAYKGEVTVGFNFDDVIIERRGKTIRIIVPEIEILDVEVDPEMEYIFTEAKYDTETTYSEASEACKKDLKKEAGKSESLFVIAKESATDTLEALLKPFESQLAEGETFEIVFGTEEEVVEQ